MEEIRILIWSPFDYGYLKKMLKKTKQKMNIVFKDILDCGMASYDSYTSQFDFDKILDEYKPDIVFLYNITRRNLCIDIPDDIKVIVLCDHFIEEFYLNGKTFFDWLSPNDYLLLQILDRKFVDVDHILDNSIIQNKIFFTPFQPCVDETDSLQNEQESFVYRTDLSVMLACKGIKYYCWCFDIKQNTYFGRLLLPFLAKIVYSVNCLIKQNETAYMDDTQIEKIVRLAMESLGIKQYVRNADEFLRYWFWGVKYTIIPTEYNQCVIDWLLERDYNIKLYGSGWKENTQYAKYAFGEIPDGSAELRKAYNYSKINISTNINMGIHRRVFEAMENGCLYFQAEAHPEWMCSDWRHYFEDGKEMIVYHNKEELYQKVDYYLSHENERKKVIWAAKERLKECPDIADVCSNVIREVYMK